MRFASNPAAACIASLLFAGTSGARPAVAQETPPPFTEVIDVREVEILFDPGVLPTFESLGKKEIGDFAAFEGGTTHSLVALTPVAAEDWTHLIYFDPALAGAESRIGAANALARRAGALARGGLVEIVVADPKPRLLASTRDAEALRRALSEVAAAASPRGRGGRQTSTAATESAAAGPAERVLQLERLTVEIGTRAGGGARALWLPVDGWALSPEELERFDRALHGEVASEPRARALVGAARSLAGYGWITFPLALRDAGEKVSPSDAERGMRVESGGTGDERTTVPIFSTGGSRARQDAASDAQLETLTDMTLVPLAELARTTSGTLVGHESRLISALANLLDRKRATYRAPRPEPGALVPVEIRWRGGDGRTLPATKLLRSGAPTEVSRARLRALLAGDAAATSDEIRLTGPAAGSSSREVCFGNGEKHPVRISFAREQGNGEIDYLIGERIEVAPANGRLCTTVGQSLASGDRRLAWIAEDLDTDAWTGGVDAAR
jgi:hypothetical protein